MTPTAIETAAETAVEAVTETEDRDDAMLVKSLVPAPVLMVTTPARWLRSWGWRCPLCSTCLSA